MALYLPGAAGAGTHKLFIMNLAFFHISINVFVGYNMNNEEHSAPHGMINRKQEYTGVSEAEYPVIWEMPLQEKAFLLI
jgi:hypothetical protein